MYIIISPSMSLGLPCYASQVADMYATQPTSPSSTSSPLKSKRYHVGVHCYVDDEVLKSSSTCTLEHVLKWSGLALKMFFPDSTFVAMNVDSSTLKSNYIVWTLCFHLILLFYCHVSWLFYFLLKNFMVSISIKFIFNLHIRNLTLKNLKFILNLHLKMLIYGGKKYSQVFQRLTCDENSMKIILLVHLQINDFGHTPFITKSFNVTMTLGVCIWDWRIKCWGHSCFPRERNLSHIALKKSYCFQCFVQIYNKTCLVYASLRSYGSKFSEKFIKL